MGLPNSSVPVIDRDAFINERSAAEFLGVSQKALQVWRVRGEGPRFARISARAIRYRRSDLIEWMQSKMKNSTSDQSGR
jgi:predicted DNA-binding transcriptional regulator AlpA